MRAPDDSESSSSSSSSTSSQLIECVKRYEADAWTRLVKVYSGLVYHWCRKKAKLSSEDSKDVTQDVFLAVARGIADFRKEDGRGTFRGWLKTIAYHKVCDHFRRNANEPQAIGGSDADRFLKAIPDELADFSDSTEEDELSERAIVLHGVLEQIRPRFSEQNWRAFWQAEVEGRPRREVAVELQMTLGAVNQAIYRIRKRLREALDELPE